MPTFPFCVYIPTAYEMPGSDEVEQEQQWFVLQTEGSLTFLLVLIEAYKQNIITRHELSDALIESLSH